LSIHFEDEEEDLKDDEEEKEESGECPESVLIFHTSYKYVVLHLVDNKYL
jgi:hypothetical protein